MANECLFTVVVGVVVVVDVVVRDDVLERVTGTPDAIVEIQAREWLISFVFYSIFVLVGIIGAQAAAR